MKKSRFNANTVIMLVVSGILCWTQKKVLDAVYRLPAIEQQIIDMKLEQDVMKARVQAWEEKLAHKP